MFKKIAIRVRNTFWVNLPILKEFGKEIAFACGLFLFLELAVYLISPKPINFWTDMGQMTLGYLVCHGWFRMWEQAEDRTYVEEDEDDETTST